MPSKEEIAAFRYGMERAAELANVADMVCRGAAGEYIYDHIDALVAEYEREALPTAHTVTGRE